MCLVFSSRKKKLLRGCHHMTEKGFRNSETSLKTNHKKCQPKLALLLFSASHHYNLPGQP